MIGKVFELTRDSAIHRYKDSQTFRLGKITVLDAEGKETVDHENIPFYEVLKIGTKMTIISAHIQNDPFGGYFGATPGLKASVYDDQGIEYIVDVTHLFKAIPVGSGRVDFEPKLKIIKESETRK